MEISWEMKFPSVFWPSAVMVGYMVGYRTVCNLRPSHHCSVFYHSSTNVHDVTQTSGAAVQHKPAFFQNTTSRYTSPPQHFEWPPDTTRAKQKFFLFSWTKLRLFSQLTMQNASAFLTLAICSITVFQRVNQVPFWHRHFHFWTFLPGIWEQRLQRAL